MSQIHRALEHYHHLRDQGVPPQKAAAHVKQRFGVLVPYLSTEQAAGIAVEITRPAQVTTVASTPQGIMGTA